MKSKRFPVIKSFFTLHIKSWFRTADGKMVIGQKPNGPQLIGLVSLIVFLLSDGRLGHVAGLLAYGSWFTWSWLEITSGVNYFRKAGGVTVLIILILIAIFR